MNNLLYQMMINNLRNYLDQIDPNATYTNQEDVPISIWTISEVLAIATGKLKEDIAVEIAFKIND